MRYGRIDLNLIAALDVLLTERSVTRAATLLNVSQSAASGILRRLREYFGDELLVQDGRRMRLTPLGESLLDPAQKTMQRVDSLIATRPLFDPATAERHFTIAASDYVVSVLLAQVLQVIAKEAPGITFEFVPSGVPGSTGLESGEVDFTVVPAHMVAHDHPRVTVFEDAYQVVAWTHNSRIGEALSLAQYQSLGHVIYRGGKVGMTWFEQWYANEHGDTRRIEVRAFSFASLPQLVVGTDRIATLQTRLAHFYAQTVPLRLLEPPIACPRLTEVLQWNRFRDQDPGIAWLRTRLLEEAEAVARAAKGA